MPAVAEDSLLLGCWSRALWTPELRCQIHMSPVGTVRPSAQLRLDPQLSPPKPASLLTLSPRALSPALAGNSKSEGSRSD